MRVPSISSVSSIIGVSDGVLRHAFDCIVITTPTSDVVVRCDPDTDEIVISRRKRRKWCGVELTRGRFRVAWTWLLTNQQGYTDGFRIELQEKGETKVFDFVSVASGIEVREAFPIEANNPLEVIPNGLPQF